MPVGMVMILANVPGSVKCFKLGLEFFTKDNGANGKVQKYNCTHCLEKGKRLNHVEKDCYWAKKSKPSGSLLLSHDPA